MTDPCDAGLVTGDSSGYDYWDTGGKSPWYWHQNGGFYVGDAYPNPMVLYNVPDMAGQPVVALELTITFDEELFEVLDVVQPVEGVFPANDKGLVLVDIETQGGRQTGTIYVKALGHPDHPEISRIGIVFDVLMDANGSFTRLDPSNPLHVDVTVTLATDADGVDLNPKEPLTLRGII